MKLRLLVEPQQGASYDDIMRFVAEAEHFGFDAFFSSDHYLGTGAARSPLPPCDAWTTIAGLARDTTRIKLGTLVSPVTFRRPGPLAIVARQVNAMSGGRVTLGLGAGWHEPEHEAYGIPFPETAVRFQQLEEQLQIVRGIWETPVGGTFTFKGRHAVLKDVPGYRGSLPGSRPSILIGGVGPQTTPRLAADYADEYNVPVRSLDVTRTQFERVEQACSRRSRDPGSIVLSAAQVLCTGESAAEVARRAVRLGRSVEDLAAAGLAGTVDQVLEKIGAFASIGATRLYLQCLDLSDTEQLHLVAERIMPLVGHHRERDPAAQGNPRDPSSGKHNRLERPA
jgi:F420-dependent oxidoreductase-like protein